MITVSFDSQGYDQCVFKTRASGSSFSRGVGPGHGHDKGIRLELVNRS